MKGRKFIKWLKAFGIVFLFLILFLLTFLVLAQNNLQSAFSAVDSSLYDKQNRVEEAFRDSYEQTQLLSEYYNLSYCNQLDLLAHMTENEESDAEGTAALSARYFAGRNLWLLDENGTPVHAQGTLALTDENAEELKKSAAEPEANGMVETEDILFFFRRLENGLTAVIGTDRSDYDSFLDNIYRPEELFTAQMNQGKDHFFGVRDGTVCFHRDPALVGMKLEDLYTGASRPETGNDGITAFFGRQSDGTICYCTIRYLPIMNCDLYYVNDIGAVFRTALLSVVIVTVIILCLLGILAAYRFYLFQDRKYMENSGLTNETIRSKTITAFLVMSFVISALAYSVFTISNLSSSITDDQNTFIDLEYVYEDSLLCEHDLREDFNRIHLENAQMIAAYLSDHPERMTREELSQLSLIFSLDFIMLFDTDGNETLSNSPFAGFSISQDESKQTFAFNPLRRGVPYVVQDEMPDELEGIRRQYIGVTTKNSEGIVSGFLLTALQPADLNYALAMASMTSVMDQSIVSSSDRYFVISPDHVVLYSTGHQEDNKNALTIGFREEDLVPHFRGYRTISGTRYFMSSFQLSENLIYIAAAVDHIFHGRTAFALLAVLMFLIQSLLVVFITSRMNIPKPGTVNTDILPSGLIADPSGSTSIVSVQTDEGIFKMTLSAAQRLSLRKMLWQNCTADQKLAIIVRRIMLVLTGIAVLCFLFRDRLFASGTIFDYILSGEWPRGLNVFALLAISMVIISGVVFISIFREMMSLFGSLLSPRAETIIRLFRSFLIYGTELTVLYISLAFLGVDVKSLVASAGILALIIGFGSKDLVKDVLAGLFIIFEREFQVGDIIQIGTYQGMVREIGIRTTKIVSWDRNVRIINNSRISNVINKTIQTSFAIVNFSLTSIEDVKKLDQIFAEKLPEIKAAHPEIIEGPEFQAILSFSGNNLKCRIAAEVKELERGSMEQMLHREVQAILQENNIPFR